MSDERMSDEQMSNERMSDERMSEFPALLLRIGSAEIKTILFGTYQTKYILDTLPPLRIGSAEITRTAEISDRASPISPTMNRR